MNQNVTRWARLRGAGPVVLLIPLVVAGCGGMPDSGTLGYGPPVGSYGGVAVYYVDPPPAPRGYAAGMAQPMPPAHQPAPWWQANSGIASQAIAGAGGFIAGRAVATGSAAAGTQEAEAGGVTGGAAMAARTMASGTAAGDTTATAATEGAAAETTGATEVATSAESLEAGGAISEAAGAGEAAEALGAGALAAGPGEVLLGALVIGGAVILGYELFHHDHQEQTQ
jgi:hypothetical protein